MIVSQLLNIFETLKQGGAIESYMWQSLGAANIKLAREKTPAVLVTGTEDMRLSLEGGALRETAEVVCYCYVRDHRGVGENREREEMRLMRAKQIVRRVLAAVRASEELTITRDEVKAEQFFDKSDSLVTGYRLVLPLESRRSECLW